MIVLDTSFVYAVLDEDDASHRDAAAWYASSDARFVTTPLVLSELDHLLRVRGGRDAASAFRQSVTAGEYEVHWWPTAAAEAVAVAEQYRDLGISLTDASLVNLAAQLDTTMVATFDERDFRAMRPLRGSQAFTLLPQDAALA